MAGKKVEHTSAAGFLRAAWEWAGDINKHYNAAVQVSLVPTGRYGVWRVSARLVDAVEGRVVAVRCQVAGEWPNSSRADLGAYIHALTMQLDRAAEPTPLEQAARP